MPMDNLPWFPMTASTCPACRRRYLKTRCCRTIPASLSIRRNFCAVVALANRRWLPESANESRHRDASARQLAHQRPEFHDMDFVNETARRNLPNASAGGQLRVCRVDTLMSYSDESWEKMKRRARR
jgi:hypothetical protein